ncbi:fumarylacetoacetate hydrolase family protein [Arthrobacter sp. NicSoilC5]|uniref:fumarylacetoacetate hydrolase family protein n=1 Tax=Arthrobacter sp. NicSoilC5 TaxID=2831000 RepID=UPI001CC4F4F5|nr:fumarylacetoacetate hydrolase family protein [Arthrobacter sp. NicSoilC5]BCW81698.1 2-hydroxyhepta-2,4-diene-1,7-dioate isomerase [Arthrobacter sp. NicSoilC5]
MKFARIGAPGKEVPALMHEQKYYSLEQVAKDVDADFWESDGPGRAAAALAAGELAELPAEGARIGAPIARPSSVICVGINYAAHAAESGSAPPSVPIIFHKAPNTVAGPFDTVAIPRGSTKTDWEVELGVVIGRRASYLGSPAQARDHIAGFVTVNDLSERTFQLEVSGGQWSKGKSCAGFCPTGPYLATPDEVDAGNLRLRSWVNGETRQNSSTRDLIFGVEQIIYDLSQFLVLEPGDLICTGTPEGVALSGRFPYLKAGDVVEIEVEGLGRQRQEFVQG